MSDYQAPLRDMRFVIHELIGSASIGALPTSADCDRERIDAVPEAAARFAGRADLPTPAQKGRHRVGLFEQFFQWTVEVQSGLPRSSRPSAMAERSVRST